MRRAVLALIAATAAAGCSVVFPIDGNGPGDDNPPDPATDKDLDGVLDIDDNCVGVPNPAQEDKGEIAVGLPSDGIGDACDPNPDDDDDEVLQTFLFNDPPEADAWSRIGEWQFGAGYVDLLGDGELIGPPLGFAPEKLIIEASFEMVDTPDMRAGLSLDPSCRGWIHVLVGTMRDIGISEGFTNTFETGAVSVPVAPRFVLQLSRRAQGDPTYSYLKVALRETDPIEDKSLPDKYVTRSDGYGIWGAGGRMRVHHVVVYAGR